MRHASARPARGYHGPMPEGRASPLAVALQQVGDRWSLLVVGALLAGPRRFGDIQDEIPGIAPNILSQRLKHLEREHLILSRPYTSRPPRLMYELTAAGSELAGALRLLAQWGAERAGSSAETPKHAPCGTPIEPRWYCPTCARAVDEDERAEVRFL